MVIYVEILLQSLLFITQSIFCSVLLLSREVIFIPILLPSRFRMIFVYRPMAFTRKLAERKHPLVSVTLKIPPGSFCSTIYGYFRLPFLWCKSLFVPVDSSSLMLHEGAGGRGVRARAMTETHWFKWCFRRWLTGLLAGFCVALSRVQKKKKHQRSTTSCSSK